MGAPKFLSLIETEDDYIQPLLIEALESQLPSKSYSHISSSSGSLPEDISLLQFRAYEALDFEHALRQHTSLINAYVIRKALIRKHYLSNTIFSWVTKYPGSKLSEHFRPAVDFELDYVEFLDDALVEAYELRESFERNDGKAAEEREWWILKPSMSDRGQGIRLFSSEDELRAIFEEWELENPDDDEENGDHDDSADQSHQATQDHIITSHLRHFVAQPYIHPPLLLPSTPFNNRKFHIRTYVIAAGALRVYVYNHMLALFASEPYRPPWDTQPTRPVQRENELGDETCLEEALQCMRNIHLTNTCVQTAGGNEAPIDSVFLLSSLPLHQSTHMKIQEQIHDTMSELFRAATAHPTNFQPLPQCFELFGVDFLVDNKDQTGGQGNVQLLEVNAFPDFAQTGNELREVVVKGLFEELFRVIIGPYFRVTELDGKDDRNGTSSQFEKLTKVLDIDLGRR